MPQNYVAKISNFSIVRNRRNEGYAFYNADNSRQSLIQSQESKRQIEKWEKSEMIPRQKVSCFFINPFAFSECNKTFTKKYIIFLLEGVSQKKFQLYEIIVEEFSNILTIINNCLLCSSNIMFFQYYVLPIYEMIMDKAYSGIFLGLSISIIVKTS